jgi:hypothetical protein
MINTEIVVLAETSFMIVHEIHENDKPNDKKTLFGKVALCLQSQVENADFAQNGKWQKLCAIEEVHSSKDYLHNVQVHNNA